MKKIKGVFRSLESTLRRSSWFGDDWEIYNRGEYLQLYKGNWYNGNQGGVHFETYIEAPQIKNKVFPICMHAEEDCPSQAEFMTQFLALAGDRISSWKGYRVVGKGYSICERTLPLNLKSLEQRLVEELGKLRTLADDVDRVLERLGKEA
ncbi:MAG: hypothetical protein MK135_13535 [Polyangiaceae bacterium]|nr:hypothetical protein [Polyangiaceae bacterium]